MRRNVIFSSAIFSTLFSVAAFSGPVTYEFTATQTFDPTKLATGTVTFDDQPAGVLENSGNCGRPTCGTWVNNPLLGISMNVDGQEMQFGDITSSTSHVYVDSFNQTSGTGNDTRLWYFFTTATFSNSFGLNSIVMQIPNICVLPNCPPSTWPDMLAIDDVEPGMTQGGDINSILLQFAGGWGNPNNPANGDVPNYDFKTFHSVPEPATLALLSVVLLGFLFRRRRPA